jgi:membrane protease YdiL (CAAX protease family)
MPAILKILIYLAAVLAAGALVAPPIFWAGQHLAAAGISDWLAGFPFHRVLSRCLQVSAVVLLWPALRWIGLRRPSELNLRRNPLAAPDAVAGFILASGLVAALAALCVSAGISAWRPDAAWSGWWRIVPTAFAVAGVEEVVFRGVVLGLCLWSLPRPAAIGLSALLFAVVHFIKPSRTDLAPAEVGWSSGFSALTTFVQNLPPWPLLAFGLASLLVAGWILGSCAVRTRSLWLPFGLHAGWVMGQQTSNHLLRPAGEDAAAWLPWVGPNLVSGAVPTGILPLLVLLLTGYLVNRYLQNVFRPVDSRPA